MKVIKITVEGKSKSGKSTVMEIIHDALKNYFDVVVQSSMGEEFPPSAPLFKRIKSLQKFPNEAKIIIFEIQTSLKGATNES